MAIKVTDYIVDRLIMSGTKVFFGYQGGNISHLIDSIGKHPEAQFVETCHEQAAAFAANAYAQTSGSIGVALASSGPGSINMINGIANAFYDSIPCVFFTGDVNTTVNKANGRRRQNAFQENDIVQMVRSVTKYATSINSPDEITRKMEKAIQIAKSDRPGPVLVNLPHDIQRSFISSSGIHEIMNKKSISKVHEEAQRSLALIQNSERPIFLVGGGLREDDRRTAFNQILNIFQIPVVCSLLGMDVISHDNPCYRGVIGDYGNKGANETLKESDCIVVLGSRLDDRQISYTMADELMETNKSIIHVDIDPNELGQKVNETLPINCDLLDFLNAFRMLLPCDSSFASWLEETKEYIEKTDQFISHVFHPNRLIRDLSEACDAVYTFDVGNNQMHSMQSVFVKEKTRILSSGGLGSMGYSIPAAIGACFADGVSKAIAICGDGGIQMNIQELQTISYYNLPVNILLLNNSGLGMIYDLQNKLFQGRHYGTTENYSVPNFDAIAKAYGFKYIKVDNYKEFANAILNMKNDSRVFLELVFSIDTPIDML